MVLNLLVFSGILYKPNPFHPTQTLAVVVLGFLFLLLGQVSQID